MTGSFTGARGFTLVEVLAAAVILSLLVFIMVQVLSLTGHAIDINSRSLDASSQARLVFDRIGSDLDARLNRPDLGMVFTKKTSGSDCFRFYSQVNSYANVRGLTAVGYRIQTATPGRIYQLERGAVGTDWTATLTGLQFLPQQLVDADSDTADNADYDVLAPGVFRLEFCYLLTNGTTLANNSITNGQLTIKSPNTSDPLDFTGVAGVVIALGVLDTKSLPLLSSPSTQLALLSDALRKTPDGADPLATWNSDLAAGLTVPGVPKQVVQELRVYERTFYVQ